MSALRRTATVVVIASALLAIALHSARRDAPRSASVESDVTPALQQPAAVARADATLTAAAAQAASAPARRDAAEYPHPITADHLRIYRDVDMLDAARRALHARDFEKGRAILAQHRAEQARAYDDMNEGLTLLADCMQYPSSVTRERAQQFYSEQTQSMVRREIRRECLEVVR